MHYFRLPERKKKEKKPRVKTVWKRRDPDREPWMLHKIEKPDGLADMYMYAHGNEAIGAAGIIGGAMLVFKIGQYGQLSVLSKIFIWFYGALFIGLITYVFTYMIAFILSAWIK